MNCFVQSFIYEKSVPKFHGLCGIKKDQVKVDYLYVNSEYVGLFIDGFHIDNPYSIDLEIDGYENKGCIEISGGITYAYPFIKKICKRNYSYCLDRLMRAIH